MVAGLVAWKDFVMVLNWVAEMVHQLVEHLAFAKAAMTERKLELSLVE